MTLYQKHPDEVVIVNSGQIRYQDLGLPPDTDNVDVQRKFEELFRARYKAMMEVGEGEGHLDVKPYNHCAPFKTLKEVKEMTFIFLSLPEYLAKYDWTGEFTEEEVDKWRMPTGSLTN